MKDDITKHQHEKINELFQQLAQSLKLSQQDTLWSVMLSQSVYAIGELGAADAKQTMQGMLDLAFEIAAEETDNSRN